MPELRNVRVKIPSGYNNKDKIRRIFALHGNYWGYEDWTGTAFTGHIAITPAMTEEEKAAAMDRFNCLPKRLPTDVRKHICSYLKQDRQTYIEICQSLRGSIHGHYGPLSEEECTASAEQSFDEQTRPWHENHGPFGLMIVRISRFEVRNRPIGFITAGLDRGSNTCEFSWGIISEYEELDTQIAVAHLLFCGLVALEQHGISHRPAQNRFSMFGSPRNETIYYAKVPAVRGSARGGFCERILAWLDFTRAKTRVNGPFVGQRYVYYTDMSHLKREYYRRLRRGVLGWTFLEFPSSILSDDDYNTLTLEQTLEEIRETQEQQRSWCTLS